jgi:restriction system protein
MYWKIGRTTGIDGRGSRKVSSIREARLFENRIHWAKFYLAKAGLIEATRRGIFKITERGQQVLEANPARIDNHFLSQFDEFRQFKQKAAQSTTQDTGSMEPILPSSQTETPDESMRVAHKQIDASLA